MPINVFQLLKFLLQLPTILWEIDREREREEEKMSERGKMCYASSDLLDACSKIKYKTKTTTKLKSNANRPEEILLLKKYIHWFGSSFVFFSRSVHPHFVSIYFGWIPNWTTAVSAPRRLPMDPSDGNGSANKGRESTEWLANRHGQSYRFQNFGLLSIFRCVVVFSPFFYLFTDDNDFSSTLFLFLTSLNVIINFCYFLFPIFFSFSLCYWFSNIIRFFSLLKCSFCFHAHFLRVYVCASIDFLPKIIISLAMFSVFCCFLNPIIFHIFPSFD